MMTAPRPLPRPPRAIPPVSLRPWLNLPPETQTQIAHLVGDLLRRMVSRHDAAEAAHAERSERR
jgi:hypothetical protein